MDFRELFLIEHARTHAAGTANAEMSVQDNVLRGTTEEQIRMRPQPGFNSLAWLFWHITRTEDMGVNILIAGAPQVLDSGNWFGKLNIDRRDFGASMSDEEVDALDRSISLDALFEYREAVGRQTQRVVRDLGAGVLDETIGDDLIQRLRDEQAVSPSAGWVLDRWNGKKKTFTLTHTVLGHSLMHLGQADINRGLLGLPTS